MMMDQHDWTTFVGKVELTLAWLELEQMITSDLTVYRSARGRGMWRAVSKPAPRGVEHTLVTRAAASALLYAAQMQPGTKQVAASPETVNSARRICVIALEQFGHRVFA